jgi:hypothetical protein
MRLVKADLAFLLLAAIVGTLAPVAPFNEQEALFNTLAAVLLVAGFVAKLTARSRAFDRDWFDGRSIAETVKTNAWKYMMRTTPYDGPTTEADAAFHADIRNILLSSVKLRADHMPNPGEVYQITPRMRAIRDCGIDARRGVYLAARVNDQTAWYSNSAAANAKAGSQWFWLGLIAQGAAISATIASISITGGPNLATLFAACAAIATAWSQIGRHDELAKSYAVAANELILLRETLLAADDDASFTAAVITIEAAISREHKMWMAKRNSA